MKKYYLVLLLASLTLGGALQNHVQATPIKATVAQSNSNIDTWMPDKNLQQAVQTTLGAKVPLTQANMSKLTQANFTSANISNLKGLEYATNLQRLDLTDNTITDVSPLGALPNLTALSLRLNDADNLPDLAALKNPNLQMLNLIGDYYGDQPAKLAGLANLTKLSNLQMVSTHLTSIPRLAPNAPLTTLDLSGNKITDVSALARYPQLTSLGISSNKISNWAPIAKLTNLTTLMAGNNPQTNIADLKALTKLQKLNLSQLGLTDADIKTLLPQLTSLTNLSIDFNGQISDLSPLANLTKLTYLNFNKDAVSDLTPLANLTKLTSLAFSNNQVSDVRPLANLTNLTSLGFLRNQVLDLSPLHNLKQLTNFNAKFQFVTKPNLTLPAKQGLVATLAAKDINGTVIPLTFASGTPVTITGDKVSYTAQTVPGSTSLAWNNANANSVSKNFSGSVVQPFTLHQDAPTEPINPVKLLVTKGDNPNLTSVASNYIMQQATLVTHANGSGILNFKVVVPVGYGKNSILFQDAQQISADKVGDSYVLNYRLPLTAHQMKQPAVLERMHVDINFNNFVYNYTYNVYFKIVHNTDYDPQPTVDPNGPLFDLPSQPTKQPSSTGDNNPRPISKPMRPFDQIRSVGLQILKGDQSQSASVANQYIQPVATLQVQPDGSGMLLVKAVVPAAFGPNSISFYNGRRVSAVKQGSNYVMTYALPLTAAQLNAPEFLETMHVDIKVGSFIYNHIYNVFFKLHGGSGFAANTPTNLIDQSFINAAILNGGTPPTNFQTPNTNGSGITAMSNDIISDAQKQLVATEKNSANKNAQTANQKTVTQTANSNRKLAAPATQPQASSVNVSGDIKKASAFVAALLGVVAVYGGWYWLKQRK